MKHNKLKNRSFLDAAKNAFNGIWYCIKTQKNIRIQLIIAVIVITISLIFKLNYIEMIFIVLAIMLVLITEVINTAIESVVDLVTKEYNPIAKIAKDVAAGAVVLASVNAVIIAIIIFLIKL